MWRRKHHEMSMLQTFFNVMHDACEPAPDIDVTRAEEALERAKERLADRKHKDVDVDRAEAALERAKARLMAAGKR